MAVPDEGGDYTCVHCGRRQSWTLADVEAWYEYHGLVRCTQCSGSSYVMRKPGSWHDGVQQQLLHDSQTETRAPQETETQTCACECECGGMIRKEA